MNELAKCMVPAQWEWQKSALCLQQKCSFPSWPQTELLMTFLSSTWRTHLYFNICKGPCPWAAADNFIMAFFPNANEYISCLEVYVWLLLFSFLVYPLTINAMHCTCHFETNALLSGLMQSSAGNSLSRVCFFFKFLSSVHSPLYDFLWYFEWIRSQQCPITFHCDEPFCHNRQN